MRPTPEEVRTPFLPVTALLFLRTCEHLFLIYGYAQQVVGSAPLHLHINSQLLTKLLLLLLMSLAGGGGLEVRGHGAGQTVPMDIHDYVYCWVRANFIPSA